MDPPPDRTPPGARRALGVALGGGTARAAGHIGVLKVLEANGYAPDRIAGTSAGAIVAAAYALGGSALELDHWVRQLNTLELWSQGLDFGLHHASLVHGERLSRWFDRKVFLGATFADTSIPLAIACTDLATGRLVVIREGSIARAVQASCALPGLLAPVAVDGRPLVDGGFVEAVPYGALATLGGGARLGVHTGIDAEHALIVTLARRIHRSPLGRAWHRLAAAMATDSAVGRLVNGLAAAVASYDREPGPPIDALEMRVAPPVAWWDFHRSPAAIAAGERAAEAMLAGGALSRLVRAPSPS